MASVPSPASATGGKTIVIKLGTSSILSETTHQPKLSILSSLVETCHSLRVAGHRVVLVCSGAIGMGKVRMGFMGAAKTSVPAPTLGLGERQALAALGQLRLIALWDTLFHELGIRVAQVLLTRNDIADRPRFLNARNTLQTLLSPRFNAIPIVNENDTVSVSELRFGDNDTLSAITAGLIDADYLFLLTDVDGLYTGNPRHDSRARRLGAVENVAKVRKLVNVTSLGSSFGTGGMMTKLIAAELATAAGVATVIINGNTPSNIVKVVERGVSIHQQQRQGQTTYAGAHADEGEDHEGALALASSISSLDFEHEKNTIGVPALEDPPHTIFMPVRHPLKSRKWSILHALHPAGTVIIDEGAYDRICRPESGGRLLAAGVVGVEGTWERMQAVRLVVRRRKRAAMSHAAAQQAEAVGEAAGSAAQFSTVTGPALTKRLNSYLRNDSPHLLPHSKSASSTSTPPITAALEAVETAAHKQADPSSEQGRDAGLVDGSSDASVGGRINEPAAVTFDDGEAEWELVEVGRGLANYNSIESERVKGIKSSQIVEVLGYTESDYLVDEMALHPLPSQPLR